jgi:hypothetical protein
VTSILGELHETKKQFWGNFMKQKTTILGELHETKNNFRGTS